MSSSESRVLIRPAQVYRAGIHVAPAIWVTPTEVIKEHVLTRQFETESRLLEVAHRAGCAPAFRVEDPMTICLVRHQPLREWLARSTPADRRAMGRLVLAQVRRVHDAGVCHRDLKPDDIVVKGSEPLLVDYELGVEVDPAASCYDIIGPASGIPVPLVHQMVGITQGVWWDTPSQGITPISRVFGHVSELEE